MPQSKMVRLLFVTSVLITSLSRSIASLSTTSSRLSDDVSKAVKQKEAPQITHDTALLNPEEIEQRKRLQGYITVDAQVRLVS